MKFSQIALPLLALVSACSLTAAEKPSAEAENAAAPVVKVKAKAKAKAKRVLPPDGGAKLVMTPVPRYAPDAAKPNGWHKRYDGKRKQLARSKNQVQILFLGDSITHYWERNGQKDKRGMGGLATFKKYFAPYKVLNLAYAGDRTQHTLWMVEQSKFLDNIKPQLTVLMIGTNNLGRVESSPAVTAEAIKLIVEKIRKKLPETKVLVFGVFPRAPKVRHKFRAQIKTINDIICKLADNENVFYCDITAKLLAADGELKAEVMPDFLHPSDIGYEVWAQAIMPYVQKYVDKK